MRTWQGLAAIFSLALIGACDDGGDAASGRLERPAGPVEIARQDLTWETPAGDIWELDVLHPVDEGPWPVMVAFHGSASGTTISAQRAVAEGGVVVVAPRWIDPEWSVTNLASVTASAYVDGSFFDLAPCALATAQQTAVDYGGDPAHTFVQGFSAGVHPAAWAALGLARADLCPDATIAPLVGLELGDLQLLFQHERWDDAFAEPDHPAGDTLQRFLEPDRWSVAEDFVARLWSTRSVAEGREIDPTLPPASWLWSRVDRGLTDDLTEVGAFDDGAIRFDDNGRLLELRMREAGLDCTHVQYDGEHRPRPDGSADAVLDVIWGQAA